MIYKVTRALGRVLIWFINCLSLFSISLVMNCERLGSFVTVVGPCLVVHMLTGSLTGIKSHRDDRHCPRDFHPIFLIRAV